MMKSMKGRRFWNGIAFRIVMIFFALLIPIYALLIISARADDRSCRRTNRSSPDKSHRLLPDKAGRR